MKKLFVFFVIAAFLLTGGFVAYAKPGVGQEGGTISTKAYDFSPERTFRWVRFMPASSSVVPGDVPSLTQDSIVIWDLVSDDGCTITTTVTSNDSAVAGVVLYAIQTPDSYGQSVTDDAGKRNWGWLQTYGLTRVRMAASHAAAVGTTMGTCTQTGCAAEFKASTTASAQSGTAGFFYDAASGAGVYDCFVRCE